MTLGAFISAGISIDELSSELKKLKLSGFELSARHITRNGISAVRLEVVITEQPDYHRHPKDIEKLIDQSDLSIKVKDLSKKIFHEVAVAEAKVHNVSIDKVHFHEVGAIDSIVDIVGTAICLEKLNIQAVYTSPVKVGNGGTVNSQHGLLPVPAPAAIEILKNYPVILTEIPFELTTPTGAAIVKALSQGMLTSGKIQVSSIGYGTGSHDIEQVPNLLRVLIGDIEMPYQSDDIISIETNIDDMSPVRFPDIIEKLLSAAVLDAYVVPIIMKKGRPGFLLSTLLEHAKIEKILEIIFQETTTLGVRIQPVERKKLKREKKQVVSSFGPVNVKSIVLEEKEQLRVEFEECKRIAEENNIPLIEVYRILDRELNAKKE